MKKFLIFLCIFLILIPSAFAEKSGYTNQKCYVYKYPSTSAARRQIPINTKLYYVSTVGKFFKVRVGNYSTKVYILKKYVSSKKTTTTPKKPTTTTSWKSKVEKTPWEVGKNYVKKNSYATIYSIDKGIELRIKRIGGTNHMDVEPATAADTEKLRKIANGTFSWKTHAMILKVNGYYIACSINTMPHSTQTTKDNNYEGQFCLHLLGSKTHETNRVNPEHQKQIERAYKWAHQ